MKKGLVFLCVALLATCAFGQEVVLIEESLNVVEGYRGFLSFLGEVRNDTEKDVVCVKIVFSLKNSNGDVLEIAPGYVWGSMGKTTDHNRRYTDSHLSPGEIGAFRINTLTPFDTKGIYTYKIAWEEGAPVDIPGTVTLLPESFILKADITTRYQGEVLNETPFCLTSVEILIASKDGAGKVIDLSFAEITTDPNNFVKDLSGELFKNWRRGFIGPTSPWIDILHILESGRYDFHTAPPPEFDIVTYLAPNKIGSFDVVTWADPAQVDSYYPKISFTPVKSTLTTSTNWGQIKARFVAKSSDMFFSK